MALLLIVMSWVSVADPAPSSFACSVTTLLSGQRCVFDGDPGASAEANQGQKNVATAAALASTLCEEAVRGTTSAKDVLRHQCRERVDQASRRCQAGGKALLDASGRFTDDGRECYRALQDAQVSVQMAAAEVVPCCECLVHSGCARSVDACAASKPSAAGKCATSCSDVCVMPDAPAEVPKP
jgi:hypothetical protein